MSLGLAIINGRRIDSSLDPNSYESIFKVIMLLAFMSHIFCHVILFANFRVIPDDIYTEHCHHDGPDTLKTQRLRSISSDLRRQPDLQTLCVPSSCSSVPDLRCFHMHTMSSVPSPPGLLDLAWSEDVYALDNGPPCHGAPELAHRLWACSSRHGDDSARATDVKREVEAAFTFRPWKPVSNYTAYIASYPDILQKATLYPCWLINIFEALDCLGSSRLASPTTPIRSVREPFVLQHFKMSGLIYSTADNCLPRLDCVAWNLGSNTLLAQHCLLLRTCIWGPAALQALGPCCLQNQGMRPKGKPQEEGSSLPV